MTTEGEFQAMLDACPDDWQTRLIFADWLQERGDPRAEGYRALGELRKHCDERRPEERFSRPGEGEYPHNQLFGRDDNESYRLKPTYDHCLLPRDWFEGAANYAPSSWSWWAEWATRRGAEDAAALAFARLPAGRRAELLATLPVTAAG